MNTRLLLAGALGGVAMFLWSGIAHMALPLGEAGVSQIANEAPLLRSMQTTLNAPGLYIFPKMAPGMDQAAYQKLASGGPSGIMVYFPKRDFSFGASLGYEFLTQLAQALIAVYLLSLTGALSFGRRVGFYALLGFVAAIATNVSYLNWYGFPLVYTLSYMFTIWVGYLCAGLVAAWMRVGGSVKARAAAARAVAA
jgi:hypothetical protein